MLFFYTLCLRVGFAPALSDMLLLLVRQQAQASMHVESSIQASVLHASSLLRACRCSPRSFEYIEACGRARVLSALCGSTACACFLTPLAVRCSISDVIEKCPHGAKHLRSCMHCCTYLLSDGACVHRKRLLAKPKQISF